MAAASGPEPVVSTGDAGVSVTVVAAESIDAAEAVDDAGTPVVAIEAAGAAELLVVF